MMVLAAIALFCDDIREEKAGTVSVIGIYPDNINVPKVPLALPKCGIYTRISFPVEEEPPKTIALSLAYADGTEVSLTMLDTELIQKARSESQAKGAPKAGLISTSLLAPFAIKKEGRINVIARIDDEDVVCGTLNVQLIGT
jgi:hypothetical protein